MKVLGKALKAAELSGKVKLNTTNTIQGAENDIVILCLVKTEGPGFMGGKQMSNVATTRVSFLPLSRCT